MVVFDLDRTLIHCDSFGRFSRELLFRQWWRVGAAVLLAPVLAVLFTTSRTRVHALSALVWLATVKLTASELEQSMAEHVNAAFSPDSEFVFAGAIAAFRAHQADGAKMVIATGATTAFAQRVCHAIGLNDFVLVGSTLRPWLAGWIAHDHCFGPNKVRMLAAAGVGDAWDCAYTDSYSDVPLLRGARSRFVVNPKSRHLRSFKRALGPDFTLLDVRCS